MKIEINKNKKVNKREEEGSSCEVSSEMDEELGVRLQEKGKQYSVESVKTLDRLEDLKHSYESMKHQVEQIRQSTDLSDYLSVSRSKSQLAQLLGSIEKLQFNKLDAVCTVNLHSGKQEAKSNRRELNAALDALQEEVSSLYAEYDKVPRPPSSSSPSSSPTPSNNISNGNSSPTASLRDVAVEIDESDSNKMECDEEDECKGKDDSDVKEAKDEDELNHNTNSDVVNSAVKSIKEENRVTPSEEKNDGGEIKVARAVCEKEVPGTTKCIITEKQQHANDKLDKTNHTKEHKLVEAQLCPRALEQQKQKQATDSRYQQMLRERKAQEWRLQREREHRERQRLHALRQQEEQQRRLLALQQQQQNYRRYRPRMFFEDGFY